MRRIGLSTILSALGVAVFSTRPASAQSRAEADADRPAVGLVWMNGEAGHQMVDLRTFVVDDEALSAGLVPTVGGGPAMGLGAGVRLWFFTVGGRARVGMFRDHATGTDGTWQLWTLDGELGLRVPIGRVEPHVSVGAGPAFVGNFRDAVAGLHEDLEVHGVNARAGAGLDYWVSRRVTIGAGVSGELLALSRSGRPPPRVVERERTATPIAKAARALQADGSSVGSSLAIMGGAGLHF
jgi:hypothetical protein